MIRRDTLGGKIFERLFSFFREIEIDTGGFFHLKSEGGQPVIDFFFWIKVSFRHFLGMQ